MRRRKRFFLTKIFIIFISLILSLGIGYAYLSSRIEILGSVSGHDNESYVVTPDSDVNLLPTVSITNTWLDNNIYYYQYSLKIKNISSNEYSNFTADLTFDENINTVQLWDYTYNFSDTSLNIIDNNHPLSSNSELTLSIIVASKSNRLHLKTIKMGSTKTSDEIALDKFNVDFYIAGGWGNYIYQYNVKLTNKTDKEINGWRLEISLPIGTSYYGGWNASFQMDNQLLKATSLSYNGYLNINSSVEFGLQLQTNIINFIPSEIKAYVR